jgi:hypothetical protein
VVSRYIGSTRGYRRCSGRRDGGRPLGFERSGSEKNLASDYHVGQRVLPNIGLIYIEV